MGKVLKATLSAAPAIARDALGLLGALLLAYGAWMAWPPAGFIVGGVMAIMAAWLLGLRNEG